MEMPSPILPIIPSFISVQTSLTTKEGSRSMIYNNGVFCSLMETRKNQREQRERAEPSQRVWVTRVFPPQVGFGLLDSQKYSFRESEVLLR